MRRKGWVRVTARLTLGAAGGARFWKLANLVAVHHEPDTVGELLDLAAVYGYRLLAEAEKAADLDLNELDFAVGRSLDAKDLTEILAIGTEDGHSLQVRQPKGGLSRRCAAAIVTALYVVTLHMMFEGRRRVRPPRVPLKV